MFIVLMKVEKTTLSLELCLEVESLQLGFASLQISIAHGRFVIFLWNRHKLQQSDVERCTEFVRHDVEHTRINFKLVKFYAVVN